MDKIHLDQLDFERLNPILHKKMIFIYNALEDGWSIKKRKQSFIFTKNHEGKKEVLEDSYLVTFMKDNFDTKKLLS